MNSFKKDFGKLYQLQDKFLTFWSALKLPFYLTGGTALGRYYLNHRYSDDLDFFLNSEPRYKELIALIKTKIESSFKLNINDTLYTDDYTRFFIVDENQLLKIEFVNDVQYRCGEPIDCYFGKIDTLVNILSNKLAAIVNRDEPKDIFDIVTLAKNYSFNWYNIFKEAKKKSIINEIDIGQRLDSFPVDLLKEVGWLKRSVEINEFKDILNRITNDFILGSENSVCNSDISIYDALPSF
jgi:hypothetical protein